MSRYQDRADELLDHSREAFDAGGRADAISLLREASSLAPMRQDIREFLAYVLEQSESQASEIAPLGESPFDVAAEFEEAREPFVAELAEDWQDVDADFHATESRKSRNSFLSSFWTSVRNSVANLTTSEDDPEIDPNMIESAEPSPVTFSRPSKKEKILQSEPRAEYERTPAPTTFDMSLDRRQTYSADKKDAVTAASRIAARTARLEKKVEVSGENETATAPYDFASALKALWRPSPQVVAYTCIYGVMFLFVSVASGSCYYKFFRKSAVEALSATAALPPVGSIAGRSVSQTEEQVVNLGSDYISRRRFDDAISLLTPAVKSTAVTAMHDKLGAELGKAYDLKGTDLLRSSKLADAIDSYKKALEYAPTDSNVAMHLGNAYYWRAQPLGEKGRDYLEKAVPVLTHAIELDPNNLHAYERLASVQESLAQNGPARETWMKIRRIAPDSDEAIRAAERLKTLSMAN